MQVSVSQRIFKVGPLSQQVFAPELVLKVATCIVERHSGYGLSAYAGNGAASGTGSGQQTGATAKTLSGPIASEETPPRESVDRYSVARQATPTSMGFDIMLDTALSRLEQQTQDAGRVGQYVGPGLRAKPRSVELGSRRGDKAREESESCFG